MAGDDWPLQRHILGLFLFSKKMTKVDWEKELAELNHITKEFVDLNVSSSSLSVVEAPTIATNVRKMSKSRGLTVGFNFISIYSKIGNALGPRLVSVTSYGGKLNFSLNPTGKTFIGRKEDNDIVLFCAKISKRHALIELIQER